MLNDSINKSHPYRSTVTQVVLKSLILVSLDMLEIDVLLQIISCFQKAVHTSAFRLVIMVTSLMLEAIIDPRYLKLDTWPIEQYLKASNC